jgi:hypothetical protein
MIDRIFSLMAIVLFVAFISPLIGKALTIRQGVPLLIVLLIVVGLAARDFWPIIRAKRRR